MRVCLWNVKCIRCVFFFFFFKQKTAYEIVSRDWSSDVCSSDLSRNEPVRLKNIRLYTQDLYIPK